MCLGKIHIWKIFLRFETFISLNVLCLFSKCHWQYDPLEIVQCCKVSALQRSTNIHNGKVAVELNFSQLNKKIHQIFPVEIRLCCWFQKEQSILFTSAVARLVKRLPRGNPGLVPGRIIKLKARSYWPMITKHVQ